MRFVKYKKQVILGVLFFLPVIFLLFLYPSEHHYNPLDILEENVGDNPFDKDDLFKERITVLAFLGTNPMDKAVAVSNLKELIYDKFKGFKGFQMVIVVNKGTESEVKELERTVFQYDELKYWQVAYRAKDEIRRFYQNLLTEIELDMNLASDHVFILDKELNQRGRKDDRTEREIEMNEPVYGLYSYNCIEVSELKNKMSEDMRILFTEYRQKRKGNFNSSSRREKDLKTNGQD